MSVIGAAPAAVSWIGAVVSVLGLVTAVLRFYLGRPNLVFRPRSSDDPAAASYHDDVGPKDGTGDRFIRARVRNESRFFIARGVQVLAYTRGCDGYEGLDIRPLRWGSAETGSDIVTQIDIPPKMERHIDLIEVAGDPRLPRIRVGRQPRLGGDWLPSGPTEIFLLLSCSEAAAKSFGFIADCRAEVTVGDIAPRSRGAD
jgi:hypothetical protein